MAPPCNTGVHPPIGVTASTAESTFDWYRATVPASVGLLTQACMDIAGPHARLVEGKGRFNYNNSTTIEDLNGRVATILHGGSNGLPNVEASGERAPALAEMLRAGGEHRVTRCDIAVDLYGDTLFEDLRRLGIDLAQRNRIETRDYASPTSDTAGKTFYLGSRKSTVFARIYEKGKKEAQAYRDWPQDVLDPWVRIELEVKPQKEMKAKAATIQPADFWGISAWTQQLAEEALSMAPEPIPFHPRRTATDERAFRFMLAQYRNLLQRRCTAVHEGNRDKLAQELLAGIFDDQDEEAA